MNLGGLKIVIGRAQGYLGLIQFAMITYMTFEGKLDVWMMISGIISLFLVMWFDIKYIFPRESSYSWNKTPDRIEMRNDIKEMLRLIKK